VAKNDQRAIYHHHDPQRIVTLNSAIALRMMVNVIKIMIGLLLLVSMAPVDQILWAQSLPEPKPACAYCGTPVPNGVHARSCPYYSEGGSKSSKSTSGKTDINAMVTEAVFKSMLTALFAPAQQPSGANLQQDALASQLKANEFAARQLLEYQKARDAAFQAEHRKSIQSYKSPDDAHGLAFKELSGSALAYKSSDEDLEGLAADSRKPFDTATEAEASSLGEVGTPTPFFGDTMPLTELRLLVTPENDPRVVDLRNASAFVVKNLKAETEVGAGIEEESQTDKSDDEGRKNNPDCARLAQKLDGFVGQRKKFQQTVNLAQAELVTWQEANRNALWNAAKDGLEYFTGQLLEKLSKRGKAAERLEQIYRRNMEQMAKEGIDVADVGGRIERLKIISSAGNIGELSTSINDWQGFVKDGMSALISQLTSSNEEIKDMLEDPKMAKYFSTEAPELSFLLDISKLVAANGVFGKWVVKKLPIIGAVEISIKQSYNALDWMLSFNRIIEANKINGQVMHAAETIQRNIDQYRQALKGCPGS
jgi:hypothetical protein